MEFTPRYGEIPLQSQRGFYYGEYEHNGFLKYCAKHLTLHDNILKFTHVTSKLFSYMCHSQKEREYEPNTGGADTYFEIELVIPEGRWIIFVNDVNIPRTQYSLISQCVKFCIILVDNFGQIYECRWFNNFRESSRCFTTSFGEEPLCDEMIDLLKKPSLECLCENLDSSDLFPDKKLKIYDFIKEYTILQSKITKSIKTLQNSKEESEKSLAETNDTILELMSKIEELDKTKREQEEVIDELVKLLQVNTTFDADEFFKTFNSTPLENTREVLLENLEMPEPVEIEDDLRDIFKSL